MKHLYQVAFAAMALSFATHTYANDSQDDGSEFTAEPLSEMDMDHVSADAGLNIISIYGPTEAGLTIDNEGQDSSGQPIFPKKQAYSATGTIEDSSEETSSVHTEEELKKILAKDGDIVSDGTNNPGANASDLQAAVEESEVEVGNAEVFTTNSEIKYKKNKFKHKLTNQNTQSGSVTITRDMHIDLLKLENLAGDHNDQTRTAGNIYLSDWSSRGDTTITPR